MNTEKVKKSVAGIAGLLKKDSCKLFSIQELIEFWKEGVFQIPSFQRGNVWNAVRTETLWNSLLRGFPIGAINIRPSIDGKGFDVIDGQQRITAISLGFDDLKDYKRYQENNPTDNAGIAERKRRSILWIDMGERSDVEQEQENGTLRQSKRDFFFRVTTAAHPWGFELSDKEQSDVKLEYSIQKNALNILLEDERFVVENCENGAKPYPYELWPVKAVLPVPFTVVRKFCSDNPKSLLTMEQFEAYCGKNYDDMNWWRYYLSRRRALENGEKNIHIDEAWKKLCSRIERLGEIKILAQSSEKVDPKHLSVYFQRLNKGGVVPDEEEVQYSMLKATLPELKQLDFIARDRM